eukprot:Sspe_Gene.83500::Locus_54774_Transcript_1_1_Confidence_1.000_Length_1187::g.83500::m.83500/K14684/SLC25A23S; solute carrier family 25 (mitochondrial phosphate transporter), member 23/24/25/41
MKAQVTLSIPPAPSRPPELRYKLVEFLQMLGAGGGAGAITKITTAPLERAKCLMQLQGMKGYVGAAAKYPNVPTTILRVVREEGFLALYRGCGANVMRIVPAYAFKFSLSDEFKRAVARPGQSIAELSLGQVVVATTAAGLCQTWITYPLEQIRQRLYLSDSFGRVMGGTGIVYCARHTFRTEGIAGFYRGLSVGLMTGAPFVGAELSAYEFLSRYCRESSDGEMRGVPCKFLCGALAGVGTQTVLYPLDTIWRRMMSDGAFGEAKRYRNGFHCMVSMYRDEGIRGFFAGCGANAMRALPAAGIQFIAYEWLKGVFLS